MITARSSTTDEIDAIIFDEEIYDRITDDNCPPMNRFRMQYTGGYFISGFVGDEIASLFIVHGKKMHFMVLKPYRRFCHDLMTESFKLWPHDVYVEIPTLYRSVINFVKNFGFQEIDILKDSHLKNGKLYDCHKLTYEV